MTEPPAADSPVPLARVLLGLAGACTVSVVLALVSALCGWGTPPLWALAIPPVLVAVFHGRRAFRAPRRTETEG